MTSHSIVTRFAGSLVTCCAVGLLQWLGACGGQAATPVVAPPAVTGTRTVATASNGGAVDAKAPATKVIAPLPIDADPMRDTSEDGIRVFCKRGLVAATAQQQAIREVKSGSLTWDNTLGRVDDLIAALKATADFSELMGETHPLPPAREAAKACTQEVERFETNFYLDRGVEKVIAAYAAKGEQLPVDRKRALDFIVRDFRRNGLSLGPAETKKLQELNEELSRLTQDFATNISSSTLSLKATPKQLEGLPESFLASHKPGPDGMITVTTDYPDYFPVAQYAKDREFALALYKLFDNRAADKNVALLDRILKLRNEKAHLLGYKTWADYIIEPRMAKSPTTVRKFLGEINGYIKERSQDEMREFRAMRKQLGLDANGPIYLSDRLYLEDQVRRAKYNLDSKQVSEYFEVNQVKTGLLDVTARLFGLRYRPLTTKDLPSAPWHPDVTAYEIISDSDADRGQVLGRFYFDLHPREGKYKHAAVFGIRDTRKMNDGSRLMPIAAIVCNFPKTTDGAPGLMSHTDVVTFFHEFGHVLHHLLSRAELSRFAGTSVPRDFVEAPSQMLEEWAWSKQSLSMFAKHYKTGEVIPDELVTSMRRARIFGRGIATARQLFLADLDQRYHTEAPGSDTTATLKASQAAFTPFTYAEGTHFQATFGHLMGYDAAYYGYQWALAIARDMFTRFEKEGMFGTKASADYRRLILEPGDSEAIDTQLTHFLGRPSSTLAYRDFLRERPAIASKR
jgi:thimet oligopeptidase